MMINMDRIRGRPIVLLMAVWLCLASLATLLIWGLRSEERSLGTRLSQHGVTTLAVVTGLDAANHNTVFYRFNVSGRTYQSGYFGDGPEGTASQLSIGQRIHIVYDSQRPTTSCYCNVAILAKAREWWTSALAGLFITLLVAVVISFWIVRGRPPAIQTEGKSRGCGG